MNNYTKKKEEEAEKGGKEGMVSYRVKAHCNNCEEDILLLLDTEIPANQGIDPKKIGLNFEHKCPMCDKWSAFKIVE